MRQVIHWNCHGKSEAVAQHCSVNWCSVKLPNFHRKASVMESPFGKTVSPHFCNCTKRDAITGVFLWIDFVNTIFSLFILLKHPFGHVLQNRSSQKFRKTFRKTPAPEFIFLKKLHTIKPATLLKRDFNTDVLLWILRNG